MNTISRTWTGSLCWCCRNAYDSCAWSREGRPVEGWRAVCCDLPPQTRRGAPVRSFFVLRCPSFALDGRFREEYSRFPTPDRGERRR